MQALAHALGERVKELNCLYSISNLMVEPGLSIHEVLQHTVDFFITDVHIPGEAAGGELHPGGGYRPAVWFGVKLFTFRN